MIIKDFNQISKADIYEVGGKGASLGELVKNGIPVPPGFVITTKGFRKNIVEEALKAFDLLGAEKVAVRSSAVAEDSLQASWAGQLETYLNVERKDLISRIKDCWNSVKSERAKAYAKRQDFFHEQLKVAVVVQKMVNAETAGVLFTVNPVTADQREIMIESVLGLGDSLVQGTVTPDNFIVDKEVLEIKTKDLQQEGNQTISDEAILSLASLGKKIEDYYGKPQDIEWAIDKQDKIWILQSRPITTL